MDDLAEGIVWLQRSGLPPRCVVKITNGEAGASVFCEALKIEKNFLDTYNQSPRFRIDEPDWMQFHDPKNLAVSIAIEAAELLEHFQWKDKAESERHAAENREAVAEEMADVAIYLLELADNLGIDLEKAILAKLDRNAE